MTREEFYDQMCVVDDLVNFCYDERLYSITDEIYSNEARDECILEDIRSMLNNGDHWESIYSTLDDLESSDDGSWWWQGHYGGWERICFENLYDMVYREMDETDSWDEEEPEFDDYDEIVIPEEPVEPPLEPEAISLSELASICYAGLPTISNRMAEEPATSPTIDNDEWAEEDDDGMFASLDVDTFYKIYDALVSGGANHDESN